MVVKMTTASSDTDESNGAIQAAESMETGEAMNEMTDKLLEKVVKMTTASSDTDESNGAIQAESMETISEITDKLLEKVARSNAHFRSQQRDEADLTIDEKLRIGRQILERGPSQFLARFAKFLDCSDIVYFERFRDDYEVDFYLNEIRRTTNPKTSKLSVKNRRYEALKKLVADGEYFSDCEMRRRNPLAFEQLVGKYMSQTEKDAIDTIDKADLRFTTILMDHMDRDYERTLCQQQMEEMTFREEFDSDEDEVQSSEDEEVDELPDTTPKISQEEKMLLREEFISIMHQSFLDGKDTDFNYKSVDDNSEYDNIQVTQQDAEDGYFDAEEPQFGESI